MSKIKIIQPSRLINDEKLKQVSGGNCHSTYLTCPSVYYVHDPCVSYTYCQVSGTDRYGFCTQDGRYTFCTGDQFFQCQKYQENISVIGNLTIDKFK